MQNQIYGSLLCNQTDFYKYPNTTESKFLEIIDTGDILLFRSNNLIGTWITRTFTKSEFDHVGLILRFGNTVEDVFILDSVGEQGVRVTPWICARQFLGGFYDKIAYRKLNFDMTA